MTTLDLSVPLQLTLALLPDIVLIGGALFLLLFAGWRRESHAHQRAVGFASIVLCVVVLGIVVVFAGRYEAASPGPIALDNFRWVMNGVILLGTIFAIALSMDSHPRDGVTAPESHVLILLASGGMMVLVAAQELILIFLGVELMSVAVYALAGINRRSARSAEGALKYFLLGAFSTAFLLYGIALVYGATGATHLTLIGERVTQYGLFESPLLIAGIAMLLIGFGFKVATVPFHMWAPDVYDGAPSPITAYMAATVKAAAFAAFLRIWLEAFPATFGLWIPAVSGLAIATMVFGNAIGLAQKNFKRLLAYSSIGHAGYLLVAIAAGTMQGSAAMVFYLLVYTLATFGAFAAVVVLTRPGRGTLMIEEMAGLWNVRPWLTAGITVLMLALLGFPIFGGAGFFAKWYILQAALQSRDGQTLLAVVLVLTTVVSAGYYLYVIKVMFMQPRPEGVPDPDPSRGLTRFVLVASVAIILALGVFPQAAARLAHEGRLIPEWGRRGFAEQGWVPRESFVEPPPPDLRRR